jgi:hypothetical protein
VFPNQLTKGERISWVRCDRLSVSGIVESDRLLSGIVESDRASVICDRSFILIASCCQALGLRCAIAHLNSTISDRGNGQTPKLLADVPPTND